MISLGFSLANAKWTLRKPTRAASFGFRGKGSRPRQFVFLRLSLNVGPSPEAHALFDRDALGNDVADDSGRLLEVDPVARLNVALKSALHDHRAGSDVGFHSFVRPDRQAVSLRVDGALLLKAVPTSGNRTFRQSTKP
jgi:hypothetical protein